MESVERIEHDGEIIAIVLRNNHATDGISFFSPPEFSQQLGLISRKKDYLIVPHVHKSVDRKVSATQEVLHMLSGQIEVSLYSKDKVQIKIVRLSGGDTILLASGGHSIKFLQDSRILEVKQGPYSGVDGDKER
ncbi:MAG: hypothetical protein M0R66_04170, partial [Candidatus Omnitrophica bacterium]|nr:hypothetical protein [Candidatus Omnitrophota bacterium]